MSSAAAADINPQHSARSFRNLPAPWVNFVDSIRPQIENMVVSHRPEHKVSGRLHKDSNFGAKESVVGETTYRHIRVPICAKKTASNPDGSLSPKKINDIVDPAVRAAVLAKLEELGGSLGTCERTGNWPCLISKAGKVIPIKKVRIRQAKNKVAIAGSGSRERFVDSGGIHHVELFVTRDDRRRERWDSEVVQVTEVYRRCPRRDHRKGRPKLGVVEPAVSRKLRSDPDAEFLFSVMKDDTLEIEKDGSRSIHRVKKFGENKQIFFVPVNDAHKDEEQMAMKISWSKYPTTLKALNPRKVVIDLLGKVHPAND